MSRKLSFFWGLVCPVPLVILAFTVNHLQSGTPAKTTSLSAVKQSLAELDGVLRYRHPFWVLETVDDVLPLAFSADAAASDDPQNWVDKPVHLIGKPDHPETKGSPWRDAHVYGIHLPPPVFSVNDLGVIVSDQGQKVKQPGLKNTEGVPVGYLLVMMTADGQPDVEHTPDVVWNRQLGFKLVYEEIPEQLVAEFLEHGVYKEGPFPEGVVWVRPSLIEKYEPELRAHMQEVRTTLTPGQLKQLNDALEPDLPPPPPGLPGDYEETPPPPPGTKHD